MRLLTLELLFLGILLLVVVGSIPYTFAGIDFSGVVLKEIHTKPAPIHAGKIFSVNATVFNGSPVTIKILNPGCMGPLRVTFDKNVIIRPSIGLGICVNPHTIINLRPGETATLSAPHINEEFIASSAGATNALLQIQYQNQISNQDTGINSRGSTTYTFFISKSLTFNVFP